LHLILIFYPLYLHVALPFYSCTAFCPPPDTSRSILPTAASGSRPTVPVRGGCTDSRAQHIDWMLCACSEREAVPDRHWRHRRRGDRKSTRLNSSHVSNSYAV